MAEQVDKFQSRRDQHDKLLAHAPISIQREPSFDIFEPHTAEMRRAKLVYIDKSNNPSEEIHTATRLYFQKNIHKAKALDLSEEKLDKHKEVNPSSVRMEEK